MKSDLPPLKWRDILPELSVSNSVAYITPFYLPTTKICENDNHPIWLCTLNSFSPAFSKKKLTLMLILAEISKWCDVHFLSSHKEKCLFLWHTWANKYTLIRLLRSCLIRVYLFAKDLGSTGLNGLTSIYTECKMCKVISDDQSEHFAETS